MTCSLVAQDVDSARPSISVAMATYNGAEYLAEQLRSLAEESFPPIELHVGYRERLNALRFILADPSKQKKGARIDTEALNKRVGIARFPRFQFIAETSEN